MTDNQKWYFEAIAKEIKELADNYTGNIEFRLNIKEGNIGNMNIILGKSIRREVTMPK